MSYQRQHPDPIFMFGALRSGTTLLRLMLVHHSKIHTVGEADFLFDHLTPDPSSPHGWSCDRTALAKDWKFETAAIDLPEGPEGGDLVHAMSDVIQAQQPGSLAAISVHRNAPIMASFFPKAKYIHLLRDPRDSARSAVGMGWDGNSYYGVRHWRDTEINWDLASIPEEQVHTIRFEDLMLDLPKELTEICHFLDLEFEPGMLKYHENTTYAPPDPSISQKWRQKASQREIALIEGLVGPLMQARGYELAEKPAIAGGIEKLLLGLDNRWRRWGYNIRRYGFGLFFKQHLFRVVGLRAAAQRLADEQQAIKLRNRQ